MHTYVVGHDKAVVLLSVSDLVRVVLVLRWRQHDVSVSLKLLKSRESLSVALCEVEFNIVGSLLPPQPIRRHERKATATPGTEKIDSRGNANGRAHLVPPMAECHVRAVDDHHNFLHLGIFPATSSADSRIAVNTM